ncbi:hypothetical protein JHD48_05270 [Sulfurimonas sp. SAG-AH-194-I05]|nr:hypothetical protein [Sulfurimonas sp. SAG-AH-194-I05]MDF1875137.1 hypothetical protein [Sulfurimonas sp. SAG-AH-194-I05]
MQVNTYLFQPTSAQQVQVGKLDASSVQKEETKPDESKTQETSVTPNLETTSPESLSVTSANNILDLYV